MLTAQVMKAVSGKFHPIFQWFHFDSMESLPANLPLPPEEVSLLVRALCCPCAMLAPPTRISCTHGVRRCDAGAIDWCKPSCHEPVQSFKPMALTLHALCLAACFPPCAIWRRGACAVHALYLG
jgi:hypothetical protein